jgi:SAM-dependent methyltransferase
MEAAEIKRRVESFPSWHYEFDLKGVKTPIADPTRINGHEQRRRYFFEPLVDLCGGSLAGKRVLDLGCNAGFWSLQAIENGADFVLGIDGRHMHIDEAKLVFEAKEIEEGRHDFVVGNIFDFDFSEYGAFDIVLCLGLLYHVSKPINLFEVISSSNDDILVIDTALSLAPGSYLRLRNEPVDRPLNATDYEIVMSPTKKAVVDMAGAFGYETAVLKPEFSDYAGCRKYRQGRRKAFMCAKKTDLSALKAPKEGVGLGLRPLDYFWLARDRSKIGRKTR